MRQKVGVKSVNIDDTHLTVVNNGEIVPIYFSKERGYECFLPEGATFELHVAYFGFDGAGYKICIDGQPLGKNSKGVEIAGGFAFLKKDVHDVWQAFHGKKNKWAFNGEDSEVKFIVCPAEVKVEMTRGIKDSNVEKTDEPQLIDYSIKRDWGKKQEIVLFLKKEQQFDIFSS